MEIESALLKVFPLPNEKGSGSSPEPFWRHRTEERRLLESVGNGGEGPIQALAEALDDGDDCNRDARGDQAIFNGGRAGFVLQEAREDGLHSGGSLDPNAVLSGSNGFLDHLDRAARYRLEISAQLS
jgi:hypothetical protein